MVVGKLVMGGKAQTNNVGRKNWKFVALYVNIKRKMKSTVASVQHNAYVLNLHETVCEDKIWYSQGTINAPTLRFMNEMSGYLLGLTTKLLFFKCNVRVAASACTRMFGFFMFPLRKAKRVLGENKRCTIRVNGRVVFFCVRNDPFTHVPWLLAVLWTFLLKKDSVPFPIPLILKGIVR